MSPLVGSSAVTQSLTVDLTVPFPPPRAHFNKERRLGWLTTGLTNDTPQCADGARAPAASSRRRSQRGGQRTRAPGIRVVPRRPASRIACGDRGCSGGESRALLRGGLPECRGCFGSWAGVRGGTSGFPPAPEPAPKDSGRGPGCARDTVLERRSSLPGRALSRTAGAGG